MSKKIKIERIYRDETGYYVILRQIWHKWMITFYEKIIKH